MILEWEKCFRRRADVFLPPNSQLKEKLNTKPRWLGSPSLPQGEMTSSAREWLWTKKRKCRLIAAAIKTKWLFKCREEDDFSKPISFSKAHTSYNLFFRLFPICSFRWARSNFKAHYFLNFGICFTDALAYLSWLAEPLLPLYLDAKF